MNLCTGCSESAHKVGLSRFPSPAPAEIADCECGCHQVIVLEEYDKETWWLPAKEPTMALALAIRERPRPGFHLTYYYREPSPLGRLGPWVEAGEVEMDPKQIQALNKIIVNS